MEPIITIKNIGKKYNINHQKGGYITLRDIMANAFKNPFAFLKTKTKDILGIETKEIFWALKDINFEVMKGEVIGIIGRNGAGKSTLLKILSQITPPTEGEIRINGTVGSLLEVGTGFHPELTGRENIFLNGAILGMKKVDIEKKFNEIVEFAGIKKFLDTPVKYYSSGMYVRLAFSVAAHMDTDILIIDEVLAVGDAEFQKKCLGKMEDITKKEGRTILFVSHDINSIKNLCKRCLILEDGRIKIIGPTNDVVNRYINRHSESENKESKNIINYVNYANDNLKLNKIIINGSEKNTILIDSLPSYLNIEIDFNSKNNNIITMEIHLKDDQNNHLAVCVPGHMDPENNTYTVLPGKHTLTATIHLPKLNRGIYFLDLSLTEPGIQNYLSINDVIALDVLGYSSKEGRNFEASLSGAGYEILDGNIKIV